MCGWTLPCSARAQERATNPQSKGGAGEDADLDVQTLRLRSARWTAPTIVDAGVPFPGRGVHSTES